jgi:hypothetical protein
MRGDQHWAILSASVAIAERSGDALKVARGALVLGSVIVMIAGVPYASDFIT